MSELDQRQNPADAVVRGDDIDTAPIPGKQVRLSPYVEHGAVCDQDATKPGCFLDAGQRQRQVNEYQQRVLAAQGAYHDAILRLQLDKLTSSPSSDLPWIAEILFDIVSAHTFTMLVGVIGALRAGEMAMIQKRVVADPDGAQLSTHLDAMKHQALSGLSETSMGWWAKEMTDKSKKGAQSALKSALGASAKSDNAKQIDYLDLLAAQAPVMFEELRETPPSVATDAQLVALRDAFEGSLHTIATYEQAISDKVARFMSSGIDKIGYRFERTGGAHVEKSVATKVVRCLYAAGPTRLAYLNSDRDDRQAIGDLIPTEFEAVAIARHEQLWDEPIQDMIVATPASSAGTLLPHASPAARAGAGLMQAAGGALPRLDLGKKKASTP